jgi:hypothetical protein
MSRADELVAELMADPDLAVEVVGGLRVAGPWEPDRDFPIECGFVRRSATGHEVGNAYRNGNEWVASVDTTLDGARAGNRLRINDFPDSQDWSPTPAEVMAAADAALTAAGWALAGPR